MIAVARGGEAGDTCDRQSIDERKAGHELVAPAGESIGQPRHLNDKLAVSLDGGVPSRVRLNHKPRSRQERKPFCIDRTSAGSAVMADKCDTQCGRTVRRDVGRMRSAVRGGR